LKRVVVARAGLMAARRRRVHGALGREGLLLALGRTLFLVVGHGFVFGAAAPRRAAFPGPIRGNRPEPIPHLHATRVPISFPGNQCATGGLSARGSTASKTRADKPPVAQPSISVGTT